MIQLRGKETGASLGIISKDDLKFLADQLGEESIGDIDIEWSRIWPASIWRASPACHEGEERT
jgi:hypothetical protein